jgi:hypothetical protein
MIPVGLTGANETLGTVCLSPAQISFIAASINNTLFQFGLMMLGFGLLFGFVMGWVIKRDWS